MPQKNCEISVQTRAQIIVSIKDCAKRDAAKDDHWPSIAANLQTDEGIYRHHLSSYGTKIKKKSKCYKKTLFHKLFQKELLFVQKEQLFVSVTSL